MRLSVCWKRAHAVDVDVVGTVLGIWTWAATVRRELLSVLCHIYKFVQQNRHRVLPLWPSVRRELTLARGARGLIYADMTRGVLPVALAGDAALVEPSPLHEHVRGPPVEGGRLVF